MREHTADTPMNQIHRLSDERQRLWREASHRELTETEYWRLQQITRELTKLWDHRRRQYAAVVWAGRRQEQELPFLDSERLERAA